MSKKGNTAEELALAMILEQRRKAKAEGKDKDKSVILPRYFQDAHHLGFTRFSATEISTILNHPLQLAVVTQDQREVESEHFIVAEKQGRHWVFAAILRPLSS